jgi:hypothetical protein
MSDQEELKRLRSGDSDAWDELWRRNARKMLQVAARRTGRSITKSAEALEEIRARAIYKFYTRICEVEIRVSVDEYLLQRISNECSKWMKGWNDCHEPMASGNAFAAPRGLSTIVGSRDDRRRWRKGLLRSFEAMLAQVKEEVQRPRSSLRQAPLLHWALFDGHAVGFTRPGDYVEQLGIRDRSQVTRLLQAAGARLQKVLLECRPALPEQIVSVPEKLLATDLFSLAWREGDYGCPDRHAFAGRMDKSHEEDLQALRRIHRVWAKCNCLDGLPSGPEVEAAEERVRESYIASTAGTISA